MTREKLARLFIGGGGIVVGAVFVLILHGAALAGAQRLESAQSHARTIVNAPGNNAAAFGASASIVDSTNNYSRL